MEPENRSVFDNGDMAASYVSSPQSTTLPMVGGSFLVGKSTPKRLMENQKSWNWCSVQESNANFGCQTKYYQIWKFILIIAVHGKNDEKL